MNEHKPERDIEDVYEEMKGQVPDKELFEALVDFFRDNQKVIEDANRMSANRKTGSISIGRVENFFQTETISTINIYPKDN